MSNYLNSKFLNLTLRYSSIRFYSSSNNSNRSSKANQYAERLIPKRILKASEQTPNFESEEKIEKISEAVQKYLKEYKTNQEFFNLKNQEFESGKRHLANIMGYDLEEMTQENIDKAINYLFPSGLFAPQSRPVMHPPDSIYPKFKTANYDKRGRPFNSFFYTGLPNYYQSLHELYLNYDELNKIEDENIAKGIEPRAEDRFDKLIYSIIDKGQLERLFIEKLKDQQYENFVNHLNKLMDHPYSAMKIEFIERFAKIKIKQKLSEQQFNVETDENGREYHECKGVRQNLEVTVRVYNKGSGIFLINDKYNLNHFEYFLPREQILSPLVMSNLLNKIDIYCYIGHPDEPLSTLDKSRQAGAIRHGLANAICAFIDNDTKELLRVNGLLQRDLRRKERKKPGLYRARAKPPHRKR